MKQSHFRVLRKNRVNLSTYFQFPEELRRLIYAINNIEEFNRQFKKVTKSISVFPANDSLFKKLYLAMRDITKKWTGRRIDWSKIHAQLIVFYGERIPVTLQLRVVQPSPLGFIFQHRIWDGSPFVLVKQFVRKAWVSSLALV